MKEKENNTTNISNRLKQVINYVKFAHHYKNNEEISKALDMPRTNFSAAINGNEKYLNDQFIDKLCLAFPELNKNWILSGIEAMQKINETIEVTAVPEDDYIMVEFEDLETAAGKLGGGDIAFLPEKKKRLVPKEYQNGNYLVVKVHGHSMDDGTKRSISDGEEVLIKECYEDDYNLPIRNKLFVVVTNEGSVIKQIKEIDKHNEVIVCHSFNPNWEDYTVSFTEIIQIFTVEKKVKSNIYF